MADEQVARGVQDHQMRPFSESLDEMLLDCIDESELITARKHIGVMARFLVSMKGAEERKRGIGEIDAPPASPRRCRRRRHRTPHLWRWPRPSRRSRPGSRRLHRDARRSSPCRTSRCRRPDDSNHRLPPAVLDRPPLAQRKRGGRYGHPFFRRERERETYTSRNSPSTVPSSAPPSCGSPPIAPSMPAAASAPAAP